MVILIFCEYNVINNKMKKVDFKKSLVRNTEVTIPKVKEDKIKHKIKNENKVEPSKNVHIDTFQLDKPELQSNLKLSKIIDEVSKHKRTKSLTENDKLALDEKVQIQYIYKIIL